MYFICALSSSSSPITLTLRGPNPIPISIRGPPSSSLHLWPPPSVPPLLSTPAPSQPQSWVRTAAITTPTPATHPTPLPPISLNIWNPPPTPHPPTLHSKHA